MLLYVINSVSISIRKEASFSEKKQQYWFNVRLAILLLDPNEIISTDKLQVLCTHKPFQQPFPKWGILSILKCICFPFWHITIWWIGMFFGSFPSLSCHCYFLCHKLIILTSDFLFSRLKKGIKTPRRNVFWSVFPAEAPIR